ncbi:MAG TPA: hypothetical protein PKK06_17550 [Phycisphaerae bacterium]|nr:hypothetical protein [Phycisphaerae bacterium]HNU45681.1 hypothetical protein [Phycisphaerae bacterium]
MEFDAACVYFSYIGPPGTTQDCGAGELRIAADLTIHANKGSHISGAPNYMDGGYCSTGLNPGKITSAVVGGNPVEATFQTDEGTTLEVYGEIDVQAKVVNNVRFGVKPISGHALPKMKLTGYPKSGSGVWFSQGGALEVDVAVSGSATWSISDDADAVISMEADCTGLTGDVDISKGLLQIDANCCTTGDLTVEGVNNHLGSDAGPRVWVARGKSASFGGSCE